MKLVICGEERDLPAATLLEVWHLEAQESELLSFEGYAIALNGRVVRRADWGATPVREEDRIEIVRAMQGG
jgi:sulfur carrier protein